MKTGLGLCTWSGRAVGAEETSLCVKELFGILIPSTKYIIDGACACVSVGRH